MRAKPAAAAFLLSLLPLGTVADAQPAPANLQAEAQIQPQPAMATIINDTGEMVPELVLIPKDGGPTRTFRDIPGQADVRMPIDPAACVYSVRVTSAASGRLVERRHDFCARPALSLSYVLSAFDLSEYADIHTVSYSEIRLVPHRPHHHRTPLRPPAPVIARSAPVQPDIPAESIYTGEADEAAPYCEVLQRAAPRGECDAYTQTVQRLKNGSAGLLAPKTMQEGETRTVSLAISRGADQSADLLGAEPSQRFGTKVSGLMAARLTGDGFAVKPMSPEVQQVAAVGGQRWDWSVTAQQAQQHELVVSIYVVADAAKPDQNRILLLTKRYPVSVNVPIDRSSERWIDRATEWLKHFLNFENALWAALTAAGAVALWKLIARLRKGKAEASD
jgi:hypothetical protein